MMIMINTVNKININESISLLTKQNKNYDGHKRTDLRLFCLKMTDTKKFEKKSQSKSELGQGDHPSNFIFKK